MESGKVLVDTSILIDHFRSKEKDRTILFKLSEAYDLFVSAVTRFEIMVGSKRDQMEQTTALLEGFSTIPFDYKCADIASTIAKSLRARHLQVEFRDVFIAATAIAINVPISTLNRKHFIQIEKLELIDV